MNRKYKESDKEILKNITIICFDGVSIDQNIEKLFGKIGELGWQERKASHIVADADANPDGIFVAEEDGQVVGYVTTRLNHYTKIGSIPNIAVLPAYQKRGIGRELIETALEYLKANGMLFAKIETLVQNQVGTRFYPKIGFKEVAKQVHYVMPLVDE